MSLLHLRFFPRLPIRLNMFLLFSFTVLLLLGSHYAFIKSLESGNSHWNKKSSLDIGIRTPVDVNRMLIKEYNSLALFGIPPVPEISDSDYVPLISEDVIKKYLHYENRTYSQKVVILTPIHNVRDKLHRYARLLISLTYPHDLISIAFGEDCSNDDTLETARSLVKYLQNAGFPRVDVLHFNITGQIAGFKHSKLLQLSRRKHLAKARNLLLEQGLKSEEWALWIDSDISQLPVDIIQQLLSANRDIVVPNCLYIESPRVYRVFDKNTWRETPMSLEKQKNLKKNDIMLEGYENTLRIFLPHLRAEGRVVPIDGVGGCTLLIRAELHRKGLHFPEKVVDHHVETEGLAKLAKRMGVGVYGMPFINVYH